MAQQPPKLGISFASMNGQYVLRPHEPNYPHPSPPNCAAFRRTLERSSGVPSPSLRAGAVSACGTGQMGHFSAVKLQEMAANRRRRHRWRKCHPLLRCCSNYPTIHWCPRRQPRLVFRRGSARRWSLEFPAVVKAMVRWQALQRRRTRTSWRVEGRTPVDAEKKAGGCKVGGRR